MGLHQGGRAAQSQGKLAGPQLTARVLAARVCRSEPEAHPVPGAITAFVSIARRYRPRGGPPGCCCRYPAHNADRRPPDRRLPRLQEEDSGAWLWCSADDMVIDAVRKVCMRVSEGWQCLN